MASLLGKLQKVVIGLITLFGLTNSAHSQDKYLYIMGGAGEPDGDHTIFDDELTDLSKFVTHSRWKTTISFDGGHSNTEEIIQKKFAGSNVRSLGAFSRDKFSLMVSEMKSKLASGQIKPGDQLLVIINTHGGEQKNELTHPIATSGSAQDLTSLLGTDTVSLDSLQEVVSGAQRHGVKLAIVDQSCFSGSTLALAGPETCVISASGPHHIGAAEVRSVHFGVYTLGPSPRSFSGQFNQSLEDGRNIEDIFIKSRGLDQMIEFPMISTPVGQEIQQKLYDLITPYLFFEADHIPELTNYYSPNKAGVDHCSLESKFSALENLLANIHSILKNKDDQKTLGTLEAALERYRDYQLSYVMAQEAALLAGDEFKQLLSQYHPDQKKEFEAEDGLTALENTPRELEKVRHLYDDMDGDEANPRKKWLGEQYLYLFKKDKIVSELTWKLSPEALNRLRSYEQLQKEAIEKTPELAAAVSIELKKVYVDLYRAYSKSERKGNVCRDFTL